MTRKEREFQEFVLDWYTKCGRHELPWRENYDPYRILVSELMLQQTQVVRVIPKYNAFIKKWPTVETLATASLGDVLRMWQGLGYNRRAKFLLQCAQVVVEECNGTFPADYDALLRLPGIGPYTAAAICAFAYNQSVALIETNVRQVYIHHFFTNVQEVSDAQILDKVRQTLPEARPREWCAALMDYGTHLKSLHGNNTSKVKGYTKQSKFKGSDREVRAALVRALTEGPLTLIELKSCLATYEVAKIMPQLTAIVSEGLVVRYSDHYQLP